MDGRNITTFRITRPVIQHLCNPTGDDDELFIRGVSLKGDDTAVMIGPVEIEPEYVRDEEILVRTGKHPLLAGLQAVQVVHRWTSGEPLTRRPGITSNSVPIIIRPKINRISVDGVQANGGGLRSAVLTIGVTPAILPTQQVRLMLNETGLHGSTAYIFSADSSDTPTDTLQVQVKGVKPGDYLTRLEVDQAQSLLVMTNGRYCDPKVTV